MKITIEFDFDKDGDEQRFNDFLLSPKVNSIVEELYLLVRSVYKYGEVPASMDDFVEQAYKLVSDARFASEE